MDFSVLVITHRRSGHLQRLLDGVQRSTATPHEVVVVYMDDPFPDPLTCTVPLRVVHIRSLPGENGLPLARARNTAARTASSERLVFLDVDCIASEAAFSLMLSAVQSHRGLVMAEPRYLRLALPQGPTPEDAALTELSVAHHLRAELARNVPCEQHEMFWSLGFAIHARDFERIGGFCTEYKGYGGEDTDFAFAARTQGIPVVFTEAVVFHQHHGVFKPPLNHLSAIAQNARVFHTRWGAWPMHGWLASFKQLGLINWDPEHDYLHLLREATGEEIEQASSLDAY